MRHTIAPFVALFCSFGLLLTGGGMLGTLLGIRMTLEWFPTQVIGIVTACYSVGFILATQVCGRLIARVGHIRAFAGLSAVAASSTLAYPLMVDAVLWGAMRVVYGFSVAGLYMVVESWLNDRTPRQFRGQVFGVYSVVTYVGLGGGQFLILMGDPQGFELFSLSAMLIALALVPVTIARTTSPELIQVRTVRLRELYRISPLGLVGAGLAGAVNGAFLGMAPVYAKGVAFSSDAIAMLMGTTIVGGFLLQYPIGRLSDLYSRRRVIAAVAFAVALVSGLIVAATGVSNTAVIGLCVLWGGLAFTLYPLAVSLTNDFVAPSQVLGASAGLLLVHGMGMVVGPVSASLLMGQVGPAGLFWTIATVAVALMLFAWFRERVGPPVLAETSTSYQNAPRNTPYGSALDPRYDEVQMEFDFEPREEATG